MDDVRTLEPLVGEWTVEVEAPWADTSAGPLGQVRMEWLLDGKFLLATSHVDHPDAPDGHIIVAAAADRPGGYLQHYFDSRGVVRLYRMTFDGRTWTLARDEADFSEFSFGQRFTATLSEDGQVITGAWDIAHEPGAWELDFRMTYRRV